MTPKLSQVMQLWIISLLLKNKLGRMWKQAAKFYDLKANEHC
jgi:hypothetical protein